MRTLPRQLWLIWSDLSSFAQCVSGPQPSGRTVPLGLVEEAISIAEKTAEFEAEIGSYIRTWARQDNYTVGQDKWIELQEIFRQYLKKMKPEPEKKSPEAASVLKGTANRTGEEDEEDAQESRSGEAVSVALAALPGRGAMDS
jgi:hypothetical protein